MPSRISVIEISNFHIRDVSVKQLLIIILFIPLEIGITSYNFTFYYHSIKDFQVEILRLIARLIL